MRAFVLVVISAAFLGLWVSDADAGANWNGNWGLHWAGAHNSKTNTCDFILTDCRDEPAGQVNVNAPEGAGRYDIYIIALQVNGIAGTRYGVCCDGSFYFYTWTKCSDFEIPSAGWPACGEGNAQTWSVEQPGPHVTIGILDVYVYGTSSLCVCEDPRVGFAEFCDGTSPEPICNSFTDVWRFSCVGFGQYGYNSCLWDATERSTWGAVKSLYR